MKKNRSCVRNLMAVLLSIMAFALLTGCAEDKELSGGSEATVAEALAEPTETATKPLEDPTVAPAEAVVEASPTEIPAPTEAELDETIDGIDFSKYIRYKETAEDMISRMNYDSVRILVTDYPANGGFAEFKDGGYAILKDGDTYKVKNKDHTFSFRFYLPKKAKTAFRDDGYNVLDKESNIGYIDSYYDLHYESGTIDVHVTITYEDDSTDKITFTITDE